MHVILTILVDHTYISIFFYTMQTKVYLVTQSSMFVFVCACVQ
jgi:hypothetical protein